MKQSEAVRLCSVLGAAYRTTIEDETLSLWATALVDHEIDDGTAAVNVLMADRRFMPSLAELLAAIREARIERLDSGPRALADVAVADVSFGQWLDANPKYRAIVEKIGRGA